VEVLGEDPRRLTGKMGKVRADEVDDLTKALLEESGNQANPATRALDSSVLERAMV